MTPSRSILVFGGTFDPPHRAHVLLPHLVAEHLGCDRILYVPAAVSPHKTDTPPTADHHRVAMLVLALDDVPTAEISDFELRRTGPSYTIDTLETLRAKHGPGVCFRLLIGTDQALAFHQWRNWESILELADPVVMLRPPVDLDSFNRRLHETYGPAEADAWMARVVPLPAIDVSSSDVRRRLLKGEDVSDALHPAVVDYIAREKLYLATPSMANRG